MPYSTHRPELMGRAELEPAGAFEAGSWASFALTYTAGRFGMDDTASLKVAFRFATDMTPCQFDDPQAPGYTTVEASNGAKLQVRYDVKGNIRPFDKTLYIKVAQGFMAEGDRIVVRFGDTRRGSPGIRLQTFCEERFTFLVLADPIATYDYVPLPESPSIAIVPGPPVAWKAVLPTLRRPGQPFRLAIKAEDRWGNPSDKADATLRLRPSRPVRGLPETVALRPGMFAAVVEDLVADEPGDLVVDVLDGAGEILTRSNALRIDPAAQRLHFWADLHGQSGETIGTNSARAYFAFARDRAFVDVASHQGNDFQITHEFWRELNDLTAEFDQPGRFVAIPGYEWSGNTALGGDRNVWFRHEGRTMRRSSHALVADRSDAATDCTTAADLLEALQGEDVVVAAHVGGRYADLRRAHDGRIEHAVEVHSAWGTFEWMLDDAFAQGYRVGVLANSDGHKGRPGASYPGASLFGAYGGLTCLLLYELSRDAVFEALRRRHHFGTTGARVVLDARARFDSPAELFERDPAVFPDARSREAREAIMGDIARVRDDAVTFAVDILAASPIERVELRDGPETLETIRPYGPAALGARIRVIWEGAEYRGRGRQVSWDGRARLSGNRFARVRPINFWNPERTLEQDGPAAVRWRSITTGNFAGFDARLDDPDAGTLAIETPHVGCEIPVRDIGLDDLAFDAGGLGRRLRAFRLPDENPHAALRFERRIAVRAQGDTRLYVCATFEDGHQAWSSPVYLFRRAPAADG